MPERGPAALGLGGGQVLLRGSAVVRCWSALDGAVRAAQRRDRLVPTPELRELLAVLRAEAELAAAAGHAAVRAEAELATWGPDALDAREAAEMLGMSERNVRRIAPELGALRVGGRWHFDRAAVVAAVCERAE